MEYQYKVYYDNNKTKTYANVKDIINEFKISKEMVINLYTKIGSVNHPVITSIERIPPPLHKKSKIIISFD